MAVTTTAQLRVSKNIMQMKQKQMFQHSILKLLLLVSACLSGQSAAAKDEWLCTEESSQLRNGAVLSCGVAEGANENEARSKAFEFAKAEFTRVCQASSNCAGHKYTVEPKRTTCKPEKVGYKCYRLLEFTFSEEKESLEKAKSNPAVTAQESLTNFANAGIRPKLKKGMKKSQVIAAFGIPEKVDDTTFIYGSPTFCGKSFGSPICMIWFENGKVTSWTQFLPGYTSDLDDEETKSILNETTSNSVETKKTKAARAKSSGIVPVVAKKNFEVMSQWFFYHTSSGPETTINNRIAPLPMLRTGETFGIKADFKTIYDNVKMTVELRAPYSIEKFLCLNCVYSNDHKALTIKRNIAGTAETVGHYWTLNSDSPTGAYELILTLEGVIVGDYFFNVSSPK